MGGGSVAWAVLASWIAEVNLQTQPSEEAANKIPFCIQFAFQSRFGWNNKLIQFGNIYQPCLLPLYQNGSWRFQIGIYIFAHIWMATEFTLSRHTQFVAYNNQQLAYKADMLAVFLAWDGK